MDTDYVSGHQCLFFGLPLRLLVAVFAPTVGSGDGLSSFGGDGCMVAALVATKTPAI
jgi:hypothetical protein